MRGVRALVVLWAVGGCSANSVPNRDRAVSGDLFPWRDWSYGSCSSCLGCCQSGTCYPGTGTAACGTGGASCQVCRSDESCVAGKCLPGCDGGSCPTGKKDGPRIDLPPGCQCPAGCCDPGGACRTGDADDACGAGGGLCATCMKDQTCQSSKCVSTVALYKVYLVSAEKLQSSCKSCTGFTGLCDFYVKLTVKSTTVQSTTKGQTNTPAWNELLLTAPETDLLQSFKLELWDEQWWPEPHIDFGVCIKSVSAADLAAGKLVGTCATQCQYIPNGETAKVTVSFQKI